VGRWTSDDPIGLARTDVNLYRYVRNDAANIIDPSGLQPGGGGQGGAGAQFGGPGPSPISGFPPGTGVPIGGGLPGPVAATPPQFLLPAPIPPRPAPTLFGSPVMSWVYFLRPTRVPGVEWEKPGIWSWGFEYKNEFGLSSDFPEWVPQHLNRFLISEQVIPISATGAFEMLPIRVGTLEPATWGPGRDLNAIAFPAMSRADALRGLKQYIHFKGDHGEAEEDQYFTQAVEFDAPQAQALGAEGAFSALDVIVESGFHVSERIECESSGVYVYKVKRTVEKLPQYRVSSGFARDQDWHPIRIE